MLNQLLAVFARSSSALCLDEISRELQAESSAVVGMLDLLVRHGRLIEVGPDGGYCAACGLQSECNLLAARGKRYVLAQPTQREEIR
jgi:DNA-binding IclR family transcriptional regulator